MTKSQKKVVLGWHWVKADGKLNYDLSQQPMIVGETRSLPPKQKPKLCARGFHACREALQALEYAQGPILCRVQVWGDIEEATQDQYDDPKLTGRHRRVLWAIDATQTLHRLSIATLKKTLNKKCLRYIQNKEMWLAGKNPTYGKTPICQSNDINYYQTELLSTKTREVANAIFYYSYAYDLTEKQFQAQLQKDLHF